MKQRYLIIQPDGLNFMTVPCEDLMEYINNSDVGTVWKIKIVEMTEDEYDALPESNGF